MDYATKQAFWDRIRAEAGTDVVAIWDRMEALDAEHTRKMHALYLELDVAEMHLPETFYERVLADTLWPRPVNGWETVNGEETFLIPTSRTDDDPEREAFYNRAVQNILRAND